MVRKGIAPLLRSSTAMVPVLLALSAPSASAASLLIGDSGPETVTVTDAQSYDDMTVGYAAGAGTLDISGAAASLAIAGNVEFGVNGISDMSVTNGGTFSTYNGTFYLANQGTLRVEGAHSLFEIGTKTTSVPASYDPSDAAGWLYTYGGDVNVSDGATLRADGLYVGGYSTDLATMTVTGKDTTLDAQLVIMVGGDGQSGNTDGKGLLTIADGATARASVIATGVDTGSTGTIMVTGAGSSLSSFYNNSTFVGKIYAGIDGDGKIVVQNGGTLSSPYEIRVAWGSGTGKLIIGGDGAAAAPGTVTSTGGVVFGSGTGQVIFNHTSLDYVFGSSITGAGAVLVKAGATTLSGAGTYTGGTLVTGGKLSVTGSLSGSANEVTLSGGQLDNSGSISGTGYGVLFDTSGNVFTTSGRVSGGTASVFFDEGGNRLNIQPGATFGGLVDYNNTIHNTTGFGTGSYRIAAANYRDADNAIALNNASQTVILENADTASGYINVVAIPGASQSASQYTSSVSDVVGSILALDVARPDQVNVGGSTISALQYGEEKRETKEAKALRELGGGLATDEHGNLFWARAFGGLRYQPVRDGDISSHTSHYGVISGVDRQFENYRLGFFGGGGGVRSVAGGSVSTMDGTTGFLGLYGAMTTGELQWNASLTGGAIENRASRSINNGAETASGDFMGWYVSPEVSVSRGYQIAPEWELTPSFKARYTGAFYNAYDESGSSQNVSYDARQTHALDGRLQVELKRKLTLSSGLPAAVIATASVSDTQYLGSGTTHASLNNNEFSVSSSADRNVAGASLGVGFDAMVSERASVYGSVDGTLYTDDSKAMSGRLGMRLAF